MNEEYQKQLNQIEKQQDDSKLQYFLDTSNLEEEFNENSKTIKEEIEVNKQKIHAFNEFVPKAIDEIEQLQHKVGESNYQYSTEKINDLYQDNIKKFNANIEKLEQKLFNITKEFEDNYEQTTSTHYKFMNKLDDLIYELQDKFNSN